MKYFLLSIFLLTACGTTLNGPKLADHYSQMAKVDEKIARVFFMRPGERHFGGKARIHIDGKRVVELPLSGCISFDLTPGTHYVMLDLWGGIGSHELDINFTPASERYFKIWPKSSRVASMVGLGVVGALIENSVAEKSNDGEMEFIELRENEAKELFTKCIYYKEDIN